MGDLFPTPPLDTFAAAKARGSRLPPDWSPSPEARQFAIGLGLDPDLVAEDFRDYWISRPGAGARKTDWLATWRMWCRRQSTASPALKVAVRPPEPFPEAPESEWWRRLKNYRPGGFWGAWGPLPSMTAPHPLIPKAELERWRKLCRPG